MSKKQKADAKIVDMETLDMIEAPAATEPSATQIARQSDFEEMLETVRQWGELTSCPMWKHLYRAVMRARNQAVIECSRCKKADLDHPQAVVQVAEEFFGPISAAIRRLNDYQRYYPLETWNSACVRAEFDHDPAALGEPILATGAVTIIGLSAEDIKAVASDEVAQAVADSASVDEGETGEAGDTE
jgi:hypothetical protein